MVPSAVSDHQGRVDAPLVTTVLRYTLKKVSRSFYLSLIILPRAVRWQISLAYLFCRAADTIVDTRMIPQQQRQQALQNFRAQFLHTAPDFSVLPQLQSVLIPQAGEAGERQLFSYLPDCFRFFISLSPVDQQLIRELVLTVTQGMEMDLVYFPGETTGDVHALPDVAALDRYTYYVAGVVGEFWTKIHRAHLPALRHIEHTELSVLGRRFGQGLQMTNILKDLGTDLRNGRCYIPQDYLQQWGLQVEQLYQPRAMQEFRPLLVHLVWYTLDHLDQAHAYILRLPFWAFRMRLSCMWPLLFAVQTLETVCRSETLLQPDRRVKMTRHAVYRTMIRSLWSLVVPAAFARHYAVLRRRLATIIVPDQR